MFMMLGVSKHLVSAFPGFYKQVDILVLFILSNNFLTLPYNSSSSQTSSPLELIQTDIWGPAPIVSNLRYKYYIHFIDDFSRYT